MNEPAASAAVFLALHVLIQLALTVRVLLRPHRDPASRIAWVVVIVALPVLGILAYILFGEVNIYSARRELVITTPYYVPDDPMQAALCASARRGVTTTIVFPARNDRWIVAAASRSYYRDLLDAGVQIFEYQGGLLHTKSLTLDGEVTLIGSANMERRSFELNYENNILLCDSVLTADSADARRTTSQNRFPLHPRWWRTGRGGGVFGTTPSRHLVLCSDFLLPFNGRRGRCHQGRHDEGGNLRVVQRTRHQPPPWIPPGKPV